MNAPHPPSPGRRSTPQGPSWRTLALLTTTAAVAVTAGVLFSTPIKQGVSKLSNLRQAHDHAGSSTGQHWTCGMHPWVILPQQGDCPICHMALVPLDPSRFTGEVTIAPHITQRIGVRTTQAAMTSLTRHIQTTGSITYDESSQAQVTLKYSGWIENLHVGTTGQPVKKGDPLLEIYAPAVYVAQEEYLTVWRNLQRAGGSTQDNTLLESARRRLIFLDVTPEQIRALEQRGQSEKTLTVYSPVDGVVMDRNVTLGAAVESGQLLYRIVDLSRVWVQAAVYEQHLPWVKEGMAATMTLPYLPGETFEGRFEYLYPYLDETTRQGKARLVFDNPQGKLRPGMFASVKLHVTLPEEALAVPRTAVLDTGERQVLFVSLGQGHFEPRQVKTGLTSHNGLLQILDGVTAGEEVVTTGQFLLDTEANTRLALAQMLAPQSDAEKKQQSLMPLSATVAGKLNAIIDHYLAMSEQLATSKQDITSQAAAIAQAARELEKETMPGQPHFWHEHTQVRDIQKHAEALTKSNELAATRLIFRELSEATLSLLKATGVPEGREKPVEQLDCSMYLEGQAEKEGGSWIAVIKEVRNPYFGAMMLRCYTGQAALPVAKVSGPADTQNHAHEEQP